MCVASFDNFWFHIYVSEKIKTRMQLSTFMVMKKEVIVPMQEEWIT